MDYLIFARRFRPQTFEEVVGQEPITTTLKNAIEQARIPQNFLFSGPRGVGKTSVARILAKCLNCEAKAVRAERSAESNRLSAAKGPTPKPCGKCLSCQEITQANSMDVLEIDGASNRGIDEIRNLRETVKFKPVTGRTKIYIIDEVHMLTTEAFNALLKTLEEPPSHVKFVFATTEPHKVPLTILSRCQRFHFKRIPTAEIVRKLEEIAKAEKLKFDVNALYLVARASEGSLRDAESLLDQLASFADKKIKEEDVLMMLGLASEDLYFSVLSALQSGDAQKVFKLVRELYDSGKDLVQFAKGLLELFRNLLLFQCAKGAEEFVEMSKEGLEEIKKHKDDFSRGELLLGLSLLGNLQNQLRRNLAPPRLLVETTLLKLLHLEGLKPLEQAVESSPSQETSPSSVSPGRPERVVPAPSRNVPAEETPASPITEKRKVKETTANATATLETGDSVSLETVQSAWPRVIEYVKNKRMSSGIFLSEAEPVELNGSVIILGLPSEFQFHKDMLEKDSNRNLIEDALKIVTGESFRAKFVITQTERAEKTAEAAPREEDHSKMSEIITQALNVFEDGKIVRKE